MADPLTAESVFAVIGLDAILAGKPTLHGYHLEDAVKMPQQIRRRMASFLASDAFKPARDMATIDYRRTLAVLPATAEIAPAATAALRAVVPDAELAMELGQQAQHCVAFGAGKIPRPTPDEDTGEFEDPDAVKIGDFARVWEVARDPLSVLGDLEDGSIMEDQVEALKELYPALYAEMTQAATDARSALTARKGKNWRPNPTKKALLDVLQQKTTFDPQLFQMVQGVYAQEQPQQQPGQAPKARKPRPRATPEGTKGQDAAGGVEQ
jgi:hypothetical protein